MCIPVHVIAAGSSVLLISAMKGGKKTSSTPFFSPLLIWVTRILEHCRWCYWGIMENYVSFTVLLGLTQTVFVCFSNFDDMITRYVIFYRNILQIRGTKKASIYTHILIPFTLYFFMCIWLSNKATIIFFVSCYFNVICCNYFSHWTCDFTWLGKSFRTLFLIMTSQDESSG